MCVLHHNNYIYKKIYKQKYQKGQSGNNNNNNNNNANNNKNRTNLKVVPTDFFVRQVGHHGLPHGTRSIAYSATQQLLAVGTDIGLCENLW